MIDRAAVVAFAMAVGCLLSACAASPPMGESQGLGPEASGALGAAKVTMGAPTAVSEIVSPVTSRCAIDAMKVCRTYGQGAPRNADTKTVSLKIPEDGEVTIECEYSAGGLVSGRAPSELTLGVDAQGFLAAHGLCAGPPGG